MQLRSALLAASILALPAAALAQPVVGPYVSLGAGVDLFQDQSVKNASLPALGLSSQTFGHISYDADYAVNGAVGWGLGNGLRLEATGDYLHGDINKIGGYSANGFSEAWGGFGNVLYDFDLGLPVTPYVGGGVGYLAEHFSNGRATASDGSSVHLGGTKGDYALDAIVGVAYNVTPNLALTAQYKFIASPSNETYGGDGFNPAGNESPLRFKTDGLYVHTFTVGLRLALWAPPEAAVAQAAQVTQTPPPAPTEARTYLVFFDWDRADLSVRARQIVAEAAQASTHVQTTKIEVNGYTDLSGTAAYNQRLSVRRAESVEAELVRDGVAKGEIDIHGYGESNPLVPTAKGVREPQNRRVEIILK
jgi:outer membrane protein OmpA-like peptidoglycan-associated protein